VRKPQRGDLFRVRLDDSTSAYFQYVVDDATQLRSQVVRVFRGISTTSGTFDASSVALGSVGFHAHVMLMQGLKQGCWEAFGHADAPDPDEILFRDSGDYGRPGITTSRDWYIWHPNEPQQHVGTLAPAYQSAEIGVIVPPDSLVYRIRNGSYDFAYPGF
jgi:hypothetical protein